MNRDFLLRDRPIAPDGSLDGASFPASSSFDKVGDLIIRECTF